VTIDLSDEDFGVCGAGAVKGAKTTFPKAAGDTHNDNGTCRRQGAALELAACKKVETTVK
jgi:hypothetical protein